MKTAARKAPKSKAKPTASKAKASKPKPKASKPRPKASKPKLKASKTKPKAPKAKAKLAPKVKPKPVVAKPKPVAVKPKPVAVKPKPVAVKPVPVIVVAKSLAAKPAVVKVIAAAPPPAKPKPAPRPPARSTPPRPDFGAATQEFFAKQPPELQPILEALRALIQEAAPYAKSSLKWGMPFYTLNGAMMCALGTQPSHVNLTLAGPPDAFVDPDGHLSGDRQGSRHLKVTSLDSLPRADVRKWLAAAARIASTRG